MFISNNQGQAYTIMQVYSQEEVADIGGTATAPSPPWPSQAAGPSFSPQAGRSSSWRQSPRSSSSASGAGTSSRKSSQ